MSHQVLPSLDAEGLGVAVVRSAGIMLGARHGIERLVNCWHGGALELGAVRQAIRLTIQVREYCRSKRQDRSVAHRGKVAGETVAAYDCWHVGSFLVYGSSPRLWVFDPGSDSWYT